MLVWLLSILYRRAVRRAVREVLEGRLFDPGRPEAGRWLRPHTDAFLREAWQRVAELVPEARLSELPTVGNRHNVFLAVVTLSAYQLLLARGIESQYASSLVADVGWKVYARMFRLPLAIARLLIRDPQRRMNATLGAFLMFPFNAPGRPGYEVRVQSQTDRLETHWTHCPPEAFVRRYVAAHGDRGELNAFSAAWCTYDWALADLLVGGTSSGHYSRAHTLSHGDAVCDMCWHANSTPRDPKGDAT